MSRDLISESANQLLLYGGITVPSYNFIPHMVAEISGGVHGSTNHVCKIRSTYEGLKILRSTIILRENIFENNESEEEEDEG